MTQKATFYLKSGNKFEVELDKLTIKRDRGRLIEVTWEGLRINRAEGDIFYLHLDRVEAITIKS